MNISAVSLSILSTIQLRLDAAYPGQTRFFPRIGNHFGDLESLINKLSKTKSDLVEQPWISYYFNRGALDLVDARIRKVYFPDPADVGKAFEINFVPLASMDLNVVIVSNHAPLLEDLEERISTRYFPLQGEFSATSPTLSGLPPISFWYEAPDYNPNYRVEPTSLGSVSELEIPLRAFFPIFTVPAESSKLIRQIDFNIYLLPDNLLVATYTWTG